MGAEAVYDVGFELGLEAGALGALHGDAGLPEAGEHADVHFLDDFNHGQDLLGRCRAGMPPDAGGCSQGECWLQARDERYAATGGCSTGAQGLPAAFGRKSKAGCACRRLRGRTLAPADLRRAG